MNSGAKRNNPDLIRLARHASQWVDERQKDFDVLSGMLDRMDRGDAITKRERQRARSALKRLKL